MIGIRATALTELTTHRRAVLAHTAAAQPVCPPGADRLYRAITRAPPDHR